jgi:hypothetical protein
MSIPVGATDCHYHLFDQRLPRQNGHTGIWGTVDGYRLLQRLVLSRSFVASPSSYDFDYNCLVDARDALGDISHRSLRSNKTPAMFRTSATSTCLAGFKHFVGRAVRTTAVGLSNTANLGADRLFSHAGLISFSKWN